MAPQKKTMMMYGTDEEMLLRFVRALERSPSSFAMPFLIGALLVAALGLAFVATWGQWKAQAERLSQAFALASADDAHLRQLLGDSLPAWQVLFLSAACLLWCCRAPSVRSHTVWCRVTSPDTARVDWLNSLVDQLWPHIEVAITRQLMHDSFLEQLINSTTFWRPRLLRNARVKVQAVVLGHAPPRVTGIKTFALSHAGPGQAEVWRSNNTWYRPGACCPPHPLSNSWRCCRCCWRPPLCGHPRWKSSS